MHAQGFRSIKNLDEYTGLKVLWLEGNGLGKIEGLEHQIQLRTLYLHENLLQRIENLDSQTQLDTLNLAQNQITRIANLGHMKLLTSLSLKANYLTTAEDLEHVLQLPSLAVLDVQSNRINDDRVVDVFSSMPNLRVLYLQGNEVVKHIKQYRKTLVYRCRQLKYLDDRPVFEDERRRTDAWGKALDDSNGDYKAAQEAERLEMEAIRREKKERDELNFQLFEQMMQEGLRKRREEKEREQQSKQQPTPETEEINQFSGERILPVQDCEFLRREREKRWEAVVNADESDSNNQQESAGAENESSATLIPVDERRLQVLHQCATVGSGVASSTDSFVAASFHVPEPASSHNGTLVAPPPAPVQTAKSFFSAAMSGVNEVRPAEITEPPMDSSGRVVAAEVGPIVTQEAVAPSTADCSATEQVGLLPASPCDVAEAQSVLMPPPAPVVPQPSHTDVLELD